MAFDISKSFRPDLPPPAPAPWSGFPPYNFIGGHNNAEAVPVAELTEAAAAVLKREGHTLATYGLNSGSQGYRPLREAVADLLQSRAGMPCSADEVMITSGSLQALDLVNAVFLQPGDTVVVEEATYGGTMTRLKARGVNYVGVALDGDGIRIDSLRSVLGGLKDKGVKPKFIYTIPTVQNPTASVMPTERRVELLRVAAEFDVPIFEDDCYADLIWEGERPPAIRALDQDGRVVYCGSFSKSIAPALRVGYVVADWAVMRQIIPLKTDAGSGALEQMVLAEYVPGRFERHVDELRVALKRKASVMVEAVAENFGASAEFSMPKGGIFLWVTLPEQVDTTKLFQAAQAEGVAINPGAEWSADPAAGRSRLRLCFAYPSEKVIREGVAKLADICNREFGVPVRSGNVERGAS